MRSDCLNRARKSPILFSEPKKKSACQKIQDAGKSERRQITFREKTDKLRARQKACSDCRSDQKQHGAHNSHIHKQYEIFHQYMR